MIVGEDRDKVRNIVHPHLSKFHELYSSSLREVEDYVTLAGDSFHQVRVVVLLVVYHQQCILVEELLVDLPSGGVVSS